MGRRGSTDKRGLGGMRNLSARGGLVIRSWEPPFSRCQHQVRKTSQESESIGDCRIEEGV